MQRRTHRPVIIAAVIALLMVAGAAWYVLREKEPQTLFDLETTGVDLDNIRGVSTTDHVRGNPNAPLVFVVYSDFGCPYCKDFHGTMSKIVEVYGKEGKVAWVFRHMPIIQLHPQAATFALASECVAQDTGNSAFWKFSDALFNIADPAVTIDQQALLTLVEDVGVSRASFVDCMRDSDLMREVEADFEEAIRAGAEGTPFTIVLTPRQRFTLKGVHPYRALAGAIQSVLPVLEADTILPPSAAEHTDLFSDESMMYFDDE